MAIKGIIFDLDGTLLDSLCDVADYANAVLLAYGFKARTQEEYRYLAGQGAYNLMAASSDSKDGDLIAAMAAEFKKVYEESSGSSKPYAGIQQVLDGLALRGVKMAILSNKPDKLTKICVEKYFCGYDFAAVCGQKDGGAVKPDPAGALEIANVLGLMPSEIAIVGDTKNDILTAKNGGFYSIGVTWGFRGREELEKNRADAIVDKCDDILELANII